MGIDGIHSWYTSPQGTAGNTISFTQAMTLDASGNLLVGAQTGASTTTPIRISSGGTYGTTFQNGIKFAAYDDGSARHGVGVNTGILYLNTSDASTVIAFGTNNTERARITSGGDLLVQTDNASDTAGIGFKIIPNATAPYVAQVGSSSSNANVTYELYSTGAAAYRFYVGYGGTVYATNTTISAISDQRFKENVRDLDVGLDAVMSLKPRKFDWKEGKGKDKKDDRGFIAQEFEQVFPDLIDEWKDPAPEGEEPYKSVRQDLIPVLVKAIQEQQAMINDLKAKVAALESK